MDSYVTGKTIKEFRIKENKTQKDLADIINVSDKTISKWETGKGLPDISLIEPLAGALSTSVSELLTGNLITNSNKCSNMKNSKIYVCPICGNVIHTIGEALISCCGITLPVLEEEIDDNHIIKCEKVENEYYISIDHHMNKDHYISFIAYVTSDRFSIVKLYAEGNCEARFLIRGHGYIYAYCNKHGLFKISV